jgi:hypothetical protein
MNSKPSQLPEGQDESLMRQQQRTPRVHGVRRAGCLSGIAALTDKIAEVREAICEAAVVEP